MQEKKSAKTSDKLKQCKNMSQTKMKKNQKQF